MGKVYAVESAQCCGDQIISHQLRCHSGAMSCRPAETSHFLYHGRGSKPLHHIQTPSVTPAPSNFLDHSDNTWDNADNTCPSADAQFNYDSFLPSEKACQLLLPCLESNTPWKVTAAFLFNICHILEDSLALFGFSTPAPSSVMLLPVLRTMRIWRIKARDGRNLERLASDLAGLINIELSKRNSVHTRILRCDSAQELEESPRRIPELQEKENVQPTRILPYRTHRVLKPTKRRTLQPISHLSS